MYAWAPILLFLVGLLVVAGLAYYAYQRKLERQRELRSVAYGQRLDFSIDDPFDTLGEPFSLLRKGDGRGVENVMWGFWQGLEIRAFDYWYYEESTDSDGHRSKSYYRFDCLITTVDALCPGSRSARRTCSRVSRTPSPSATSSSSRRSSTAGSR